MTKKQTNRLSIILVAVLVVMLSLVTLTTLTVSNDAASAVAYVNTADIAEGTILTDLEYGITAGSYLSALTGSETWGLTQIIDIKSSYDGSISAVLYGATYNDSEYSKASRISGYVDQSVDYMDGDDSTFVLEYGAHYVVELDWDANGGIDAGYANLLLHINHKKSVTADASTMVDVSVYYGEVEDEMWYDDWLNKAKPTDDVSVKWSYDGGVLTKATHVGTYYDLTVSLVGDDANKYELTANYPMAGSKVDQLTVSKATLSVASWYYGTQQLDIQQLNQVEYTGSTDAFVAKSSLGDLVQLTIEWTTGEGLSIGEGVSIDGQEEVGELNEKLTDGYPVEVSGTANPCWQYYGLVTVEGTDDYTGLNGYILGGVTINKREVGVVWSDDILYYNGDYQFPDYTLKYDVGGQVNANLVIMAAVSEKIDTSIIGDAVAPGVHTASLELLNSGNYEWHSSYANKSFTIQKGTVGVTISLKDEDRHFYYRQDPGTYADAFNVVIDKTGDTTTDFRVNSASWKIAKFENDVMMGSPYSLFSYLADKEWHPTDSTYTYKVAVSTEYSHYVLARGEKDPYGTYYYDNNGEYEEVTAMAGDLYDTLQELTVFGDTNNVYYVAYESSYYNDANDVWFEIELEPAPVYVCGSEDLEYNGEEQKPNQNQYNYYIYEISEGNKWNVLFSDWYIPCGEFDTAADDDLKNYYELNAGVYSQVGHPAQGASTDGLYYSANLVLNAATLTDNGIDAGKYATSASLNSDYTWATDYQLVLGVANGSYFTITPKPVELSISKDQGSALVYDGTEKGIRGVSYQDVEDETIYELNNFIITYTDGVSRVHYSGNTFDAWIDIVDPNYCVGESMSGKYTIDNGKAKVSGFAIQKRLLEVNWTIGETTMTGGEFVSAAEKYEGTDPYYTFPETFTYNGGKQLPGVTFGNVITISEVADEINVTGAMELLYKSGFSDDAGACIIVGIHQYNLQTIDNADYYLPSDGQQSVYFKIVKKALTVSFEMKNASSETLKENEVNIFTHVYDGTAYTIVATVNGLEGEADTARQATVNAYFNSVMINKTSTNVISTTATIAAMEQYRITEDDAYNYYLANNATVEWEITPATITVTTMEQLGTLLYTGSAQTPALNVTASSVNLQEITYLYSKTGEAESYVALNKITYTNVPDCGTLYYKLSADNHNDATGSFTITMNKVNAAWTAPTAKVLTYDGNAQELVNAPTDLVGVAENGVEYSLTNEEESWSTSIPTGLNAGEYNVYVRTTGDDNHYNNLTAVINLTMARYTVVPTFKLDDVAFAANTEKTYKSANYTITAVASVNLTIDAEPVNKTIVFGQYASASQKVVGKLTLTVPAGNYPAQGDAENNYCVVEDVTSPELTIIRADFIVTPTAGQHKTYGDGDPSTYTSTTSGKCVGDDITYFGSVTRDAGEDVGTYSYKQGESYIAGDDVGNYNLVIAAETFEIVAKDVTVTFTHLNDIVYDGEGHDPTPTIVGLIAADQNDEKVAVAFTGGSTKSAGNYDKKFQLTGTKASNYNLVATETYTVSAGVGTVAFQILQKTLTFTWTGLTVEEAVYDGDEKSVTAYISSGVVGEDDVSISGYINNTDFKNAATDLGSYTAKIHSLTGNNVNNYTLEGSTGVTYAWAIIAFPITYKQQYMIGEGEWTDYVGSGVTYAGVDIYFRVVPTNKKGTDDVSFLLNGQALRSAISASDDSYVYTLTLSGVNKDNYYLADNTGVEYFINKADYATTVGIQGWTYGDAANNPNVTTNPEGGNASFLYKVKDANDDTYTADVPTDAGNYTVKGTIEATANYNSTSATVDFTINRYTITPYITLDGVTANGNNATVVYDGQEHTFTLKAEAVGGTINIGNSIQSTNVISGSITVGEDQGIGNNYRINADATFTYSITARPLTIVGTIDEHEVITYGNEPALQAAAIKLGQLAYVEIDEGTLCGEDNLSDVIELGLYTLDPDEIHINIELNEVWNVNKYYLRGIVKDENYAVTFNFGDEDYLEIVKKQIKIKNVNTEKINFVFYDGEYFEVKLQEEYFDNYGLFDYVEGYEALAEDVEEFDDLFYISWAWLDAMEEAQADVVTMYSQLIGEHNFDIVCIDDNYEIETVFDDNAKFSIARQPVYIVPAEEQGKIYGEVDGEIVFIDILVDKWTYDEDKQEWVSNRTSIFDEDAFVELSLEEQKELIISTFFEGSLSRENGENADLYDITLGSLKVKNLPVEAPEMPEEIEPFALVAPNPDNFDDNDAYLAALADYENALNAYNETLVEYNGALNDYTLYMMQASYYYLFSLGITEEIYEIAPKAITVTADDKTSVYGDADAVLTATVTPGLVGNDKVSDVCSLSRVAGNVVGEYVITAAPANNANYIITTVQGTYTITAKPITVVADNKTSVYGEADVALTATVTPGLVGNDKPYTLSRVAGKHVGEYTITVVPANDANYIVTPVNGVYTITAKPITITADNKESVYGAQLVGLTATLSTELVEGDTAADVYTLRTDAVKDAGSFAIYVVPANNANYAVTPVNGVYTIKEVAPTTDEETGVKTYTKDIPVEEAAKGVNVTDLFKSAKDDAAETKEVKATVGTTSIVFDKAAIVAASGVQNAKLVVEITESDAELEAIADENLKGSAKIISISLANTEVNFGEGKVTVTADFDKPIPKGMVAKVYYVDANGNRTNMNATFANGKVTFETNHFSIYVVVYEKAGLSTGALVGIIIACVVVLALVVFLLYWFVFRKKKTAGKATEKVEEKAEEPVEEKAVEEAAEEPAEETVEVKPEDVEADAEAVESENTSTEE